MAGRVTIKKEASHLLAPDLWIVRDGRGELWGYSRTWWGAWRMACGAVGYKVPR